MAVVDSVGAKSGKRSGEDSRTEAALNSRFSHLLDGLSSAPKHNVRSFALALGDTFAVVMAVLAGWVVGSLFRYSMTEHQSFIPVTRSDLGYLIIILAITLLLLLSCNFFGGHYSRGKLFWSQVTEEFKIVAYVVAVTTIALFATKEDFSRPWLVSFWFSLVVLLPMFRTIIAHCLISRGLWFRGAVIIGDGENARSAAAALESDIHLGFKVVGYIKKNHSAIAGENYEARRVAASHLTYQLDEAPFIVFAFDSADDFTAHREEIEELMAKTSSVVLAPPLSGLPMHEAEVLSVFKHDSVLLRLQNNLKNPWANVLKRMFDICVGGFFLVLALPLFLGIGLLVKRDGGSALFKHKRIGKNGKPFYCYKFRSMVPNAEEKLREVLETDPAAKLEWESTFKLKKDVRVTPLGRWMRRTSIDELPQIWNVLRGEMSLVGPRPIVDDEVARYGDDYKYVSSIKPGMTGLWQISGRNDVGYAERIRLDKWYIRNWSIWQDVVIILKSFPIVFSRRGAY